MYSGAFGSFLATVFLWIRVADRFCRLFLQFRKKLESP